MSKTIRLGWSLWLVSIGLAILVALVHDGCQAHESDNGRQVQFKAGGPSASAAESVGHEAINKPASGRRSLGGDSKQNSQVINYGHLFDGNARSSRLAATGARSFEVEPAEGAPPPRRRTAKQRRFQGGARSLGASVGRKSRARAAKLSKARAMAAARHFQARSMRNRRSAPKSAPKPATNTKQPEEIGNLSYDEFDSDNSRKPLPFSTNATSRAAKSTARHIPGVDFPLELPKLPDFQLGPQQQQQQHQEQQQVQKQEVKTQCNCRCPNNEFHETIDGDLKEEPTTVKSSHGLTSEQRQASPSGDSSPVGALVSLANNGAGNSPQTEAAIGSPNSFSVKPGDSELKLSGSRKRPEKGGPGQQQTGGFKVSEPASFEVSTGSQKQPTQRSGGDDDEDPTEQTSDAEGTPRSEDVKAALFSELAAKAGEVVAKLADKEEKKEELVEEVIEAKHKLKQPPPKVPKPKPKPKPKPEPEPEPEPVYTSRPVVYHQPYASVSGNQQPYGPPQHEPAYPKSVPEKCAPKLHELIFVLKEVAALVERLSQKVVVDLSIDFQTRETLSRKLAKIRAAVEESLLAGKLGKLRLLNDAAKVAGIELIRLSHFQVAVRLEPGLKKLGAKLRRVYGLYRKFCKRFSH